MTERAARLQSYIDATPAQPTVGVDDCGPWVMRWASQEVGHDLSFPSYTTRAEGYAIAARAGGLVALANSLLSNLPVQWSQPQLGDVAVIGLSDDRATAAIVCAGGIMVVRGERHGVLYLKPRSEQILKVWNIDGR